MSCPGWIGTWRPGIGDPSAFGWTTVVAYFGAAWLCWRARQVATSGQAVARRSSALLWSVLAASLVALGVNKQLDLQSAVTELARSVARDLGWYEERQLLQFGFIAIVVLLAVGMCLWLAFLAREELRRVIPALIGWVALCAFVAIRAASFHHVDRLLGTRLIGARMNVILELGGITVIAIGALKYCRGPM